MKVDLRAEACGQLCGVSVSKIMDTTDSKKQYSLSKEPGHSYINCQTYQFNSYSLFVDVRNVLKYLCIGWQQCWCQ
jgi:hypothetical protein